MRKPDEIERLYLDFDGFFASVEQQADPRLRGRPVGVVPFSGTDRTAVIACSKEAKAHGVKNVMPIAEARRVCPDLILVPQNPDLYRRAHNALLCEIETVIAIDTAKSIDELTCVLDDSGRRDPELLAARIKAAIADNIGRCITSSIGFAANRQLAKIACKAGKEESKRLGSYGDALAIWRPGDMPEPLWSAGNAAGLPIRTGRSSARRSTARSSISMKSRRRRAASAAAAMAACGFRWCGCRR